MIQNIQFTSFFSVQNNNKYNISLSKSTGTAMGIEMELQRQSTPQDVFINYLFVTTVLMKSHFLEVVFTNCFNIVIASQ